MEEEEDRIVPTDLTAMADVPNETDGKDTKLIGVTILF